MVVMLVLEEKEVIKGQYGKFMDVYGCLGEFRLKFGGVFLSFLVLVMGCIFVGRILDVEIYKIIVIDFYFFQEEVKEEECFIVLKKIFSLGVFYFLWFNDGFYFDLIVCMQKQGDDSFEWGNFFFWNQLLYVFLRQYQVSCCDWLLKIICGVVIICIVYVFYKQVKVCFIFCVSCECIGICFYICGVNDDGYVFNFVEIEQMIYMDDGVLFFVQIRGFVLLFWEQLGFQVGFYYLRFYRGLEVNVFVFDRYMVFLKEQYGQQVVVNFLGSRGGEEVFNRVFKKLFWVFCYVGDIFMINFDFYQFVKGGKLEKLEIFLRLQLKLYWEDFDVFIKGENVSLCFQKGILWMNCFDCLD